MKKGFPTIAWLGASQGAGREGRRERFFYLRGQPQVCEAVRSGWCEKKPGRTTLGWSREQLIRQVLGWT